MRNNKIRQNPFEEVYNRRTGPAAEGHRSLIFKSLITINLAAYIANLLF